MYLYIFLYLPKIYMFLTSKIFILSKIFSILSNYYVYYKIYYVICN